MVGLFHKCGDFCQTYKDREGPYVFEEIGPYKFKRCPLNDIDRNVYRWIQAYGMFKGGFLPTPEGWLSQTNKFIEMMNIIQGLIAQEQKKDG